MYIIIVYIELYVYIQVRIFCIDIICSSVNVHTSHTAVQFSAQCTLHVESNVYVLCTYTLGLLLYTGTKFSSRF